MGNNDQSKIFMLAGERSGDLHGSNLIKSLLIRQPSLKVTCWGGDMMQEAGAKVTVHYNQLAFMGFWEVFKNLLTIRKLLKQCKEEILKYEPDLIVLIDYPGFNLKIAEFAKARGIPVHYYIAPKAWAWNASRATKIARFVDKVYGILPFEVDFFRSYGVNIEYVGNPLIDAIDATKASHSFSDKYNKEKTVAVLPGSRYQEVSNMLGLMTDIMEGRPDYTFLIAAVDNLPKELYETAERLSNVELVYDGTYDILRNSKAAIVTSGTATLETALLNCPQVVCYRTSPVTYAIAKRLIKIKYISLVNLIADKGVVRELIQHDFNEQELNAELSRLLDEEAYRAEMFEDYKRVKEIVTDQSASDTTAHEILMAISAD
ncbi:MAG: lipid-A-disaccharide synthase [Cyclobacteriaceae bacterium]